MTSEHLMSYSGNRDVVRIMFVIADAISFLMQERCPHIVRGQDPPQNCQESIYHFKVVAAAAVSFVSILYRYHYSLAAISCYALFCILNFWLACLDVLLAARHEIESGWRTFVDKIKLQDCKQHLRFCFAFSSEVTNLVAILGYTLRHVENEIRNRDAESTCAAPATLGYRIFLYTPSFSTLTLWVEALFTA